MLKCLSNFSFLSFDLCMYELFIAWLIQQWCSLFFFFNYHYYLMSNPSKFLSWTLKKQRKKSVLRLDLYQTSAHPVQNRKNRKAS